MENALGVLVPKAKVTIARVSILVVMENALGGNNSIKGVNYTESQSLL